MVFLFAGLDLFAVWRTASKFHRQRNFEIKWVGVWGLKGCIVNLVSVHCSVTDRRTDSLRQTDDTMMPKPNTLSSVWSV